ncbi:MAG: SMP-30/gluconolactonase/LRE family protein [Candidatus Cloacimonetes bacterium]|nr:SMP-30/gluconolactonase/LRE family protein [Candidatus Cloacimonadota bacterium]
MKKSFLILGIISITMMLFSQNLLNQPESVEWDHIHAQWLVSNHATGEIVSIDSTGEQSIFSDTLSSTRGLKVREDKLYAASNDGLAIFDLAGSYLENLIPIPEAVLLNDLDFDSQGNLFVSDYWDNKIYKINTELNSYELFIDYGIIAPNGLIFDEEFNRMLVCAHEGFPTVIHSFDVSTAETELLLYPNFYSLDGFACDIHGNIYVSSWYTDSVYMFEGNNINNNVEIAASGFNDPADIFINQTNNILAVPNFSDNSVSFVQLAIPVNIHDNSIQPITLELSNHPNPFNPTTTISFSLTTENTEDTELVIYNLKGQKVRKYSILNNQFSISWDGTDENNKPVSSGIYFYKLKIGKYEKIKKMILMK